MATYKFENFKAELIDPTILKVSSSFSTGDAFVQVGATLQTPDGSKYGVDLGQMPNTDDWSDVEVIAFATAQLETFKI